jgi:hypothetical protein
MWSNKCSQGIGAEAESQIHNKPRVITEELCEPKITTISHRHNCGNYMTAVSCAVFRAWDSVLATSGSRLMYKLYRACTVAYNETRVLRWYSACLNPLKPSVFFT